MPSVDTMKTVLVAGGSYAGHEAVKTLSELLPMTHRVVLLERNSHFHHVYSFPRFSVLPGHEHKAFIPYTNVFGGALKGEQSRRHQFIQATLNEISVQSDGQGGLADYTREGGSQALKFDYMVYALGSQRPGSINLWTADYNGSKVDGIEGLQKIQRAIKAAQRIVIVGAGPLGVQFAGDIAEVYGPGSKEVVLLSSSAAVLPRLNAEAQGKTLQWLQDKGVHVVMGERLQGEPERSADGVTVQTNKGQAFQTDVVLDCRGLTPNTFPLKGLLGPDWQGTSAAKTNVNLQLLGAKGASISSIYIAGDAGDAFGAHKNGKNAREQAGIASRNIVRQIAKDSLAENCEQREWAQEFLAQHGQDQEIYKPTDLRIKITLGLQDVITQSFGQSRFRPGEGAPDLNVEKQWISRDLPTEDLYI